MLFRFQSAVISLALFGLALPSRRSIGLEATTPADRLARQSWSMENGLPQNTVPVLLQSRAGYLWIGTEAGLARFDGNSFTLIAHGVPNGSAFPNGPALPPGSSADADIRCLLEDRAGDLGEALWAGTGDGLLRWKDGKSILYTTSDGLPSNSIRGLVQTPDGTLWVWTEAGLAYQSENGFQRVSNGASIEGISGRDITSIAGGSGGEVWVGSTHGVSVFKDHRWLKGEIVLPQQGGGNQGESLVADAGDGRVLISTTGGVYAALKGSTRLIVPKATMPTDEITYLKWMSGGTVAIASKSSLVLAHPDINGAERVERFAVAKQLPGSRIEIVYADRENSLWVGTNHGLVRVVASRGASVVQLLPPTDPLAVDSIASLLEDREGDLWVGTETAGLHILRDARLRMIGALDGLSSDATTTVMQDRQGIIWIGTRESGLNSISPRASTGQPPTTSNGNVKPLTTADGLLSNIILSLASAPDGDLWVGTPDGLNRIVAGSGKILSLTSADGLPDDFIRSLLVAPDNSLWIGTRRGLTHLDHGKFRTFTHEDGLGSDLVGALARTSDGDIWVATLSGLSRIHQGQIRNYTSADGLPSDVITALDVQSESTVWIGTQDGGLALWDGNRFLPVRNMARHGSATGSEANHRSDPLPKVIHAVLHDDLGNVWLATNFGLTRVDKQALLDCAEHGLCAAIEANAVNFTTIDGLRSRDTSSNSHPTASRMSNGELWFATPRGVAIADPTHFAPMPGPPPVVIERFAVDDQPLDQSEVGNTKIKAGHLRFQFDYVGLSFAAPQRLRYQYMLEGFDHAWIDAGTRRTAYYTNIPHGTYRFRVRAALNDSAFHALSYTRNTLSDERDARSGIGVGLTSEAAVSFELLPHYYQTLWFRALIFLIAAELIWLVIRRRILRVERQFSAVMTERNRIAREIHDTLAQGYVGISLQLEILGELLRHHRTEAASQHLMATRQLVTEGLEDARQSIWALRSQDAAEQTLPVRLKRLIEKAQDSEISVALEVHGAFHPLPPQTEREMLRIAQEAIQNVKRHAAASNMVGRLDYTDRLVRLSITDDGRGFGVVVPQASPKNGNGSGGNGSSATKSYGLTGIRERAALIGADIEILSEPGQGTTITVTLPAPQPHSRQGSETTDFKPSESIDKFKEKM